MRSLCWGYWHDAVLVFKTAGYVTSILHHLSKIFPSRVIIKLKTKVIPASAKDLLTLLTILESCLYLSLAQ